MGTNWTLNENNNHHFPFIIPLQASRKVLPYPFNIQSNNRFHAEEEEIMRTNVDDFVMVRFLYFQHNEIHNDKCDRYITDATSQFKIQNFRQIFFFLRYFCFKCNHYSIVSLFVSLDTKQKY